MKANGGNLDAEDGALEVVGCVHEPFARKRRCTQSVVNRDLSGVATVATTRFGLSENYPSLFQHR